MEPRISCVRDRDSTTQPQGTEQILILNPIHASVIFQILWIPWIQWKRFRENSIDSFKTGIENSSRRKF